MTGSRRAAAGAALPLLALLTLVPSNSVARQDSAVVTGKVIQRVSGDGARIDTARITVYLVRNDTSQVDDVISIASNSWRRETDSTGTFRFDAMPGGCYRMGLVRYGRQVPFDAVMVHDSVIDLSEHCFPVSPPAEDLGDIVVEFDRAVAAVAVVATEILRPPDQRVLAQGWRVGVGGGLSTLFIGGMTFVAPTATVFGAKDSRWYVSVQGGWRPMAAAGDDPLFPDQVSTPRPQFRPRAEGMLSAQVAYYPADSTSLGWWGVAAGVGGAWETVRELDEFLERAYGITVGPRLRWNPLRRFDVLLGVDLQAANLSEFGTPDSRWRFGIGPSATVAYFLR